MVHEDFSCDGLQKGIVIRERGRDFFFEDDGLTSHVLSVLEKVSRKHYYDRLPSFQIEGAVVKWNSAVKNDIICKLRKSARVVQWFDEETFLWNSSFNGNVMRFGVLFSFRIVRLEISSIFLILGHLIGN